MLFDSRRPVVEHAVITPMVPTLCLKYDHLLLGLSPHRPGNAADAVAGLAAAGERHPVCAEGRVVIDHYGRGGEALGGIRAFGSPRSSGRAPPSRRCRAERSASDRKPERR